MDQDHRHSKSSKPKERRQTRQSLSQTTEGPTPRTLIRNALDALDTEAPSTRQMSRVLPSPSPSSSRKKRRRSSVTNLVQLAATNNLRLNSQSEVTPRTLIHDVLDSAVTEEMKTRQRSRVETSPAARGNTSQAPFISAEHLYDVTFSNNSVMGEKSVNEESFLMGYVRPSQDRPQPGPQLGSRNIRLNTQRLRNTMFTQNSQPVEPNTSVLHQSQRDANQSNLSSPESSTLSNESMSAESFLKGYLRASQETVRGSQGNRLGSRNIQLDTKRLHAAKFIESAHKKKRKRKVLVSPEAMEMVAENQDWEEVESPLSAEVPPSIVSGSDIQQPFPDISMHERTERQKISSLRPLVASITPRQYEESIHEHSGRSLVNHSSVLNQYEAEDEYVNQAVMLPADTVYNHSLRSQDHPSVLSQYEAEDKYDDQAILQPVDTVQNHSQMSQANQRSFINQYQTGVDFDGRDCSRRSQTNQQSMINQNTMDEYMPDQLSNQKYDQGQYVMVAANQSHLHDQYIVHQAFSEMSHQTELPMRINNSRTSLNKEVMDDDDDEYTDEDLDLFKNHASKTGSNHIDEVEVYQHDEADEVETSKTGQIEAVNDEAEGSVEAGNQDDRDDNDQYDVYHAQRKRTMGRSAVVERSAIAESLIVAERSAFPERSVISERSANAERSVAAEGATGYGSPALDTTYSGVDPTLMSPQTQSQVINRILNPINDSRRPLGPRLLTQNNNRSYQGEFGGFVPEAGMSMLPVTPQSARHVSTHAEKTPVSAESRAPGTPQTGRGTPRSTRDFDGVRLTRQAGTQGSDRGSDTPGNTLGWTKANREVGTPAERSHRGLEASRLSTTPRSIRKKLSTPLKNQSGATATVSPAVQQKFPNQSRGTALLDVVPDDTQPGIENLSHLGNIRNKDGTSMQLSPHSISAYFRVIPKQTVPSRSSILDGVPGNVDALSCLEQLTAPNKPIQPSATRPLTDQTRAKQPKRKTRSVKAGEKPVRMPSSITKKIFSSFSNCRIPRKTWLKIEEVGDRYWKNLVSDLEALTSHAHRHTVEQSDIELLMKRQGFLKDGQTLNSLIAKHLPMEYRQKLIPVARAGNVVVPFP